MDAQIRSGDAPSNILSHISELIQKADTNELKAIAQEFFSPESQTPAVDSDPVDLTAISIDLSTGETGETLLETIKKCDSLRECFQAVRNASEEDKAILQEELALHGVSSLDEYLKLENIKTPILRAPQEAATSVPLVKMAMTNQLLQPAETTTATTEDLIGDAGKPGPIIQKLSELIAGDKLDNTQKEDIEKIKNCFLENRQLELFPPNDLERAKKYQNFASRLMTLFEKLDESELLAAFALGEGSLCELPEVCYTGWHQRIEGKMPYGQQSDSVTNFTLSSVMPKRREIFFDQIVRQIGLETGQDPTSVHLRNVLQLLYNETLSLGYLPSEINTDEAEHYIEYMRAVCDRTDIKETFAEKCTPQILHNTLKESLSGLDSDKRDVFMEELSTLYKKACLKSPNDEDLLLDPMQEMRVLYDRAKEANEEPVPQTRLTKLKTILTQIMSQFSVTPFKMHPKILEPIVTKLRTKFARQMHSFRLLSNSSPETNWAQALKAHLENKKSPENKSLFEDLDSKDKATLEELSVENEYTTTHKKEVGADLERCNTQIIDCNAAMFEEFLKSRDPQTVMVEGFSDFAVQMCLHGSGVVTPKDNPERTPAKLLQALSDASLTSELEKVKKIDDREKILELLPHNEGVLYWASDELLRDPQFIVDATKINPKALKFSLCTTSELICRAIQNCSSISSALELYKDLPDNAKKDVRVIDACFEKCDSTTIYYLYAALPDDIKQDTAIINACIEKCDSSAIPGLYMALPDDIKQDTAIINACIEKCDSFDLVYLYKAIPEPANQDDTIIQKFVQRHSEDDTAKLYKALPRDAQEDPAIINACIKKCDSTTIPYLYEDLPDDTKKQTTIINACIEKCYNSHLVYLYKAIPEPANQDDTIIQKFVQRHSEDDTVYLYKALPRDAQEDPAIINACIEKCGSNVIPGLYMALPDDIKQDTAIINACIEKCGSNAIPALYNALPDDTKKQTTIINACIEKCGSHYIPRLYKALPEDINLQAPVLEACIEKCDGRAIYRLYKALPRDVQEQAAIINTCIEKCCSSYILELYKKIPEPHNKDDAIINAVVEKCGDMEKLMLFLALPDDIKERWDHLNSMF